MPQVLATPAVTTRPSAKFKLVSTPEIIPLKSRRGTQVEAFRIQAIQDFGMIRAGTFGGLVSGVHNLDPNPDHSCWIAYQAAALGHARVLGDAQLNDHARIERYVTMQDHAVMAGHAFATDEVTLLDAACASSYAQLRGHTVMMNDATIIDNVRISNHVILAGDTCLDGSTNLSGRQVMGHYKGTMPPLERARQIWTERNKRVNGNKRPVNFNPY